MKAVFRGWNDDAVSTDHLMAGKLKGARGADVKGGLRVVGLGAAVGAVRGG